MALGQPLRSSGGLWRRARKVSNHRCTPSLGAAEFVRALATRTSICAVSCADEHRTQSKGTRQPLHARNESILLHEQLRVESSVTALLRGAVRLDVFANSAPSSFLKPARESTIASGIHAAGLRVDRFGGGRTEWIRDVRGECRRWAVVTRMMCEGGQRNDGGKLRGDDAGRQPSTVRAAIGRL